MYIDTVNTIKARELCDKRKKTLHIAGTPASAESYGIFIEGIKHTVEVNFSFNKQRWIVGTWGHEHKRELEKDAKRKEFLDVIRAYLNMD